MATNQRVQAPFGDIAYVQTPMLDRVGNLLYQEQRMREAKYQQENQQLEQDLLKDVGKVRPIDQAALLNRYNQYKQIKKQLYFDKDLQKNPLEFNKRLQEANAGLANFYADMNKSKQYKDEAEGLIKDRFVRPKSYAENFGAMMGEFNNTPLEKLQNHNWDNFRDFGSDIDLQKIMQGAEGKPEEVFFERRNLDDKGLQKEKIIYKYGNSPSAYKDSVIGALALQGGARSASAILDRIPKEEIDKVNEEFSKLTPEDWERRTGSKVPQQLRLANPNNDSEVLADYLAKKSFVSNRPSVESKTETDLDKELERKKKDALDIERYRQGKIDARIALRQKYKNATDQQKETVLDGFVKTLYEDAKASGSIEYKFKDDKIINQYEMKADPKMKALFATSINGKIVEPNALRFSEDGKEVTPIFWAREEEGENQGRLKPPDKDGRREVQDVLSKPMLIQAFKARIGKDIFGQKEVNETFEEDQDGDEYVPPVTPKKSTKKGSSGIKWQ